MWPDYFYAALGLLGAFVALCGHLALWVMAINRIHATALPRPLIKAIDKVIYLALLGLPLVLVYSLPRYEDATVGEVLFVAYALMCIVAALFVAATRINEWHRRSSMLTTLVSNHTAVHNAAADLGYRPVHGVTTRWLASLPANQIFELHVNVKTLRLPNLPPKLDGLSILHLSDIHMTGRFTQPFFDYVVDRANELDADLVAITGDIVEKTQCLPWIKPTLGRLKAREGKFFVLGNHDKRLPDVPGLRSLLAEAGLEDLGGRWLTQSIRGQEVILAGNELPWFGAPPDVPLFLDLPMEEQVPFRILLSHSPDQIYWARLRGFDLMLAGHNHGGQIRPPFIGPIVSPSYFGVKYASGLFDEPPTLLHVSRGVCGLEPVRFNCPPEITKLVLTSKAAVKI